jgi:hypothetical protein
MTINYTTLLGLAKPVTGTEANTWGDVVNDSITSLLDTAIAGTTTITADTTLTTTTGAANQSRQAILLCSPASANITITAPAQSKIYTVINTSGYIHSKNLWRWPDHRRDIGGQRVCCCSVERHRLYPHQQQQLNHW